MADYALGLFCGAFLTGFVMLFGWYSADKRALDTKIWRYGDRYFALEPMKLVKAK